MKKTLILFPILIGISAVFAACAQVNSQASDVDKLIGDWSGESICVNKEKAPACNDEKVVYHITKIADKPDTVNLSADRIVDNKPVFMGAFDFVYDAKQRTLTSEVQNQRVHFLIEFVVRDDVLEGTMTLLPDKIQIRKMSVKKNTP